MIFKSILGGFSISIGALLYVNNPNPIGAVLFSFGLYSICWLGFLLYTGKIGYARTLKDFAHNGIILIGNLVGTLPLLLIDKYNMQARGIVSTKISQPLYLTFFMAIVCGFIIYAAVDAFRQGHTYSILIAVPVFILCKAEHSIADLCFVMLSKLFNLKILIFIIVVIIGNAVGALVCSMKGRTANETRRVTP